jgi:Na+(H+)/acetate symporter ActP
MIYEQRLWFFSTKTVVDTRFSNQQAKFTAGICFLVALVMKKSSEMSLGGMKRIFQDGSWQKSHARKENPTWH